MKGFILGGFRLPPGSQFFSWFCDVWSSTNRLLFTRIFSEFQVKKGKHFCFWSWNYSVCRNEPIHLSISGAGIKWYALWENTLYHKAWHTYRQPILEWLQAPAPRPSKYGELTCGIVKHLVIGLLAGVPYLRFVRGEVVSCGEGY